ncbi:MAG: hypothetical protein KAG82_06900 [Alcanivoracaceae bacterium]|jgi:hypothetical protein|nr:hypothetical protein [Alcanivoracaceae bacterium]
MGAVSPRFSGFAVVAACLLASGCASLREHAPDSLAALIDRSAPPVRVAGLDYSEITALGVHGSCDTLAQTLEQKRTLPRRELEGSLLPSCQAEVEAALARERESARLDELIEQAWQALLARRERERQAEERRMLEAELQRRQLQQQQQQKQSEQQAASRESRRQDWQQRLVTAAIHGALAELEVPDRPLAFSAGQISERSLSNFLACVELAYPNRGYKISRDGRKLVVIAEKAALPRGRMPIEARFTEHDEYWLLTYLKVAEITAATAQDRFILAQNLVAQSCYGEDGLL